MNVAKEPKYTALEMEAALCIWEWINDHTTTEEAPAYPALNDAREAHGTFALRSAVPALATWLLTVYDAALAGEWDSHSYDWEIVPAIMGLVEWRADGQGLYDLPHGSADQLADKAIASLRGAIPCLHYAGVVCDPAKHRIDRCAKCPLGGIGQSEPA